MAAADALYFTIGEAAAQGDLDRIMRGVTDAHVKDVAHGVRRASENSHIHVLKTLLPMIHGANLDGSGADIAGNSGFTALHFAIHGNATPETIQVLIDAGACPHRPRIAKKKKQQVDAFQQLSDGNSSQSKKEEIHHIMCAHRCSSCCREDADGWLEFRPATYALDYDMATTPIIPSVDSQCLEEPAGVWKEPKEPNGDDDELPKTNEKRADRNKIPRLG